MDLAKGHVKAVDKLADKPGLKIYNLGTGKARLFLTLSRLLSQLVELRFHMPLSLEELVILQLIIAMQKG